MHRSLEQLYSDASDLNVALDLRESMQASNAKLWQLAWQHLDATLCQSLSQALDKNHDVSLTLCSDTSWRHYRPQPVSWLNKLHRLIQPVSVIKELRALSSGVSAP